MIIIKPERFASSGLAAHESFFVELWHSMVHAESIDSYRVKCMNPRTLVRELSEEISLNFNLKEEELQKLCLEVKSFIEPDPVCYKYYPKIINLLVPLLTNTPRRIKDDKKTADNRFREFCFLLEDFSTVLRNSYFKYIIAYLPTAIKPDNETEIRIITSNMLSDLIDRGWSLESLISWPRMFLSDPAKSFSEKLQYALRILQLPIEEYEIVLKISNCSKISSIGALGDFTFVSGVQLSNQNNELAKRFTKNSQAVCYAKTTVADHDFREAAIQGRENLEKQINLLRFGFEPNALSIDDIALGKRIRDQQELVLHTGHNPPNPSPDMAQSQFTEFTADLEAINKKIEIDKRSRRQIQAAIRQYRFGRDSNNYEDKFLYWWMGLEALAHFDEPAIGATVTHNVSRCMSLVYLRQLLEDLLSTLRYCRIPWAAELAALSHAPDLESLNVSSLMGIIESPAHRQSLLDACSRHYLLSSNIKKLIDTLSDKIMTVKFMKNHMEHLEWQIDRLYRIRCCIVHGSEVRFRLRLITANLEYYLRQVILVALGTFKDNDHIHSLEELFLRASITYDRLIQALEKPDATALDIRNAVIGSIAVNN
jgi:hypothetical protein